MSLHSTVSVAHAPPFSHRWVGGSTNRLLPLECFLVLPFVNQPCILWNMSGFWQVWLLRYLPSVPFTHIISWIDNFQVISLRLGFGKSGFLFTHFTRENPFFVTTHTFLFSSHLMWQLSSYQVHILDGHKGHMGIAPQVPNALYVLLWCFSL